MSKTSNAGIKTAADGASFIPASRRADGSTRKEIKIRPGYRPPEDIETYKSRNAEAWKNRGQGGVPGAEPTSSASDVSASKSKNAKRREAARKRTAADESNESAIASALQAATISGGDDDGQGGSRAPQSATNTDAPATQASAADAEEVERQKKIRNQLKKLKAVRELKDKKAAGEKLSPDQLMKIGKEGELRRDLKKLGYEGPEVVDDSGDAAGG